MINSITICPEFEEPSNRTGGMDLLEGFALPALPAGHVLDTNSHLVVLIGDNGAGKTTFLRKLNAQYRFTYICPKYFALDSDQGEPSFRYIHYGEKLSRFGYMMTCPEKLEKDPKLPTYSQGQFRYENLRKFFSEHSPCNDVLLMDQPEDGIALRRRQDLVDLIANYAFSNERQIFVATHEPRFLSLENALILNLDDHPATSTRGRDFDLETYVKAGNLSLRE